MTKCNISGFQHIIAEMKLVIERDGVNGETKKNEKIIIIYKITCFGCFIYVLAQFT